jgi:molybdopterin synthase catalytic subunit
MRIRVQDQPFDPATELTEFTRGCSDVGAIVTFSGIVRGDNRLSALEIEHYPGMTETALTDIASEAAQRWSLDGVLVIHRYGALEVGETIMMVATAAQHRQEAFEAADFLMDYLKSRAPFWKKEHRADGESWVDAKKSDEAALKRWKD